MKRRVNVPAFSYAERKVELPAALALKMLREIGVGRMINEALPWDKARWKRSPGVLAEGVVLATMSDIRPPLCRIQDHLDPLDLGSLFGEGVESSDFNQYNIGEMLERLGQSEVDGLYQRISLNALTLYHVAVQRLHADTTTISFSGAYDTDDDSVLRVERGYNKDGRPQDKQVLVGQITTDSGLVVTQKIMSGNTSDVTWNALAIDHVKAIQRHLSTSSVPFIADSKLVCQAHIKTLLDGSLSFISRLPANYGQKLAERSIRRACSQPTAWHDLGRVGSGKQASTYRGQRFMETIEGKPVRLLVLHSSSLEEKARAAMANEQDELILAAKKLETKRFYCESDAQEELVRFHRDRRLERYETSFEITCDVTEQWPRGRRKEGAVPLSVTTHYRLKYQSLVPNEPVMARALAEVSCIVLIAHVPESYSDVDVLTAYKGQQAVENSFRLLKTPAVASVIYLENEHRIAGLLMLLHLSLLIRALIQYRMRRGHERWQAANPDSDMRLGYDNKKTTSLTYAMFHEHCRGLALVLKDDDVFELRYTNRQNLDKILKYLEFMNLDLGDVLDILPC